MNTGVDIAVSGVSVTRGGTQILNDVTLSARAGEILALVGPNGAGKSTLLGALSGDIPADGSITIGGRPVADIPLTELALIRSVLTQRLAVDFPFTAGEVIAMGRAPHHGSDPDLERRVVADCGVAAFLNRPIGRLSGGEQARVHMARVLVQDTPVLMLDEPTAALDFRHAEEILTIARERARAGCTVIVVLHDLSAAAAWADRVAILESGRLVAIGCPDDTLTEDRVSAVYGRAVEVMRDSAGNPVIQPRRRKVHDSTE